MWFLCCWSFIVYRLFHMWRLLCLFLNSAFDDSGKLRFLAVALLGVSLLNCFNIRIKHGFSCITIRQVPWEMLKTEAEGRGFQHLLRSLANVNALKNHVWSLWLHKNCKHLLHFALFLALLCFVLTPKSRERNLHGLCSFYGRVHVVHIS